ncbi:reverse transcriptase domain-containing protein [Tanacetum coccineum]
MHGGMTECLRRFDIQEFALKAKVRLGASLTPPYSKKTIYAYLSCLNAVQSPQVHMTERNGRQCPVQYVSRTLNEAERNYSPLEKLSLSLVNMTRRLRRYFEAHPVQTKSPLYPRNAERSSLAAYLSDAPDGEREDEYFQSPRRAPPEIDDMENLEYAYALPINVTPALITRQNTEASEQATIAANDNVPIELMSRIPKLVAIQIQGYKNLATIQ